MWLRELVLVTGQEEEGQRLRDSDEKDLQIPEERNGGFEELSHQNKLIDEKSLDRTEIAVLDGCCCRDLDESWKNTQVFQTSQHYKPSFLVEARNGGGTEMLLV